MKPNRLTVVAVIVALALSGCENDRPVDSQTCAKVNEITDPSRKAELQRQCVRSGEFKRSPTVHW